MKHLKYFMESKQVEIGPSDFDSFNDDIEISLLYDGDRKVFRDREPFNDIEINSIKNIFKEYDIGLNHEGDIITITLFVEVCKICKCKDEWYYVEYYDYISGHIYDECDQFDDLINCLEILKEEESI